MYRAKEKSFCFSAYIYIQTVYSANISRITILHTTSALHAERKCTSFFEPSVLQYSHEWTSRRKKLHALFFRYYFRSNFLTVYRNDASNLPWRSYGLGATSICETLFEIPHGLRAVLKMVRPMTSGSKRFFVISSKPLVGMKQTIRRWIDIVEAHLFHI